VNVHLHRFSKIKVKKKSQNSKNKCFSYYFCLMIEGSGSGSIPLTYVQCLAEFSGSLAETMGGTSGGIYSLLFTAAARAFQASIH
jgi:hypothetical protein